MIHIHTIFSYILWISLVYNELLVYAGRIVVPGAFYAEAGFAISKQLRHRGFQAVSVSADFIQAMTISKDDVTDIDVHEAEKSEDQWSFKIVKDNRYDEGC